VERGVMASEESKKALLEQEEMTQTPMYVRKSVVIGGLFITTNEMMET
jgi:hypothetical protein